MCVTLSFAASVTMFVGLFGLIVSGQILMFRRRGKARSVLRRAPLAGLGEWLDAVPLPRPAALLFLVVSSLTLQLFGYVLC